MGKMRLMLGPIGSGKSQRVFGEMRATPGLRYLWVPDQYASEAERQLIEALDVPGLGFGGPDILTLSLLRRRVLDSSVLIDEAGRRMVVRALLDDAASELISIPARAYGMPAMISGLFALLRQAGIGGAELSDVSMRASPDEPGRWSDLIWLMAAYHQRLDGRYWDDEEADRRLTQALPSLTELGDAHVWVDRFDSVPPRTARLIAAMASIARQVTVVLNYDDAALGPVYEAMEPSLAALSDAARQAGVPLEYAPDPPPDEGRRRAPELEHMITWLHGYPRRAWDAPAPALSLASAPSPAAEARAAADAVVDWVGRFGWRLREFAVITADLERYAPLLEHAFARRGIPYFIDRRRSSLAHPAVRALLAACEAAATGWAPEPMAAYLRSGYSGLEDDAAALLLRAASERDLRGPRWNRRLTGPWAGLEPHRRELMAPLILLRRRLHAARCMTEGLTAAYEHLIAAGTPRRLERDIAALQREGHPVDALETAQIWALLVGLLDQADALMGGEPCDAQRLFRVLEAGLSAAEIAVIPPTLDEILISTPNRVKTPPLKAVFLLGANAGVLLPPAPPGLLTAAEIEACREAGLRLSGPQEGDELARLRLMGVLASASERVCVSYAQAGEDGALLRPAPIVGALRHIFPKLDERLLPSEPASRVAPLGPIILPAAIADAISPRRVAVTGLERYAACPAQFFLRNILRPHRRLEPYPTMPDTGTVLHALVEAWMDRLMRGDIAALTRDQHAALAQDALASVLGGEAQRPGWDEGRMRYWRRRIAHLADETLWAALAQLQAGDFRPIALEHRFADDTMGPVAVRGTIDRIDRAGQFLRVVDYKSGGAAMPTPPSLAAVFHGLSLQLPLYARAAASAGGEVVGMYHFSLRDRLLKEEDAGKNAAHRLLGWTLDREGVLRATDREGTGSVVTLTGKDGNHSIKDGIGNAAVWAALLDTARDHAARYAQGMWDGAYAPDPRYLEDGGNPPCDRCDARNACDFPRNSARRLVGLKDAEVVARLSVRD